MMHVRLSVERGRRNSQPFLAAWHRWVVDRLDVDAVLREQQFARTSTLMCISGDHRQNVAWRVENGEPRPLQHGFERPNVELLPAAFLRMRLKVPYRRQSASGEMGAKRGRENETVGEAPNDVDYEGRAGNIAAHHPK